MYVLVGHAFCPLLITQQNSVHPSQHFEPPWQPLQEIRPSAGPGRVANAIGATAAADAAVANRWRNVRRENLRPIASTARAKTSSITRLPPRDDRSRTTSARTPRRAWPATRSEGGRTRTGRRPDAATPRTAGSGTAGRPPRRPRPRRQQPRGRR